ncbi:hypothetical protein [Haliangium sp.]|uniref:hypothetical protein n=1 Tax=Haliangium sp. TaxID=2663208 RepID=UPI003D13C6EB
MRRGPFACSLWMFLLCSGITPAVVDSLLGPGGLAPVPGLGRAQAEPSAAPTGDELVAVDDIVTNTGYVEDIAVDAGVAWVATRGGLEVYELPSGVRSRLYTNADGLAEIHVYEVQAEAGQVEVRTRSHRCRLDQGRFRCASAPVVAAPVPAVGSRFEDARVTAREPIVGADLVGTAGAGLWLVGRAGPAEQSETRRRLTPQGQVCSNHIMAMADFSGRLYLGSFDEGLCVSDGAGFRRLATPFRMINDLVATPAGLYVAANSGLYHSRDGREFSKVDFVSARGVNGLAVAGDMLYATTPATLWQIPLARRDAQGLRLRRRQYWLPGGSRAVQKVSAGAGAVWMASEDRGVIRFADGAFEVFDRAGGMPTSWVMDVAVGADGVLYAASFRHGLVAVPLDAEGRPRVGQARAITGLPDHWLLRARVMDGGLWVGTQQGAARVEAGAVTAVVRALPHPCVHALARFGERTWLATEGGLVRLREGRGVGEVVAATTGAL